MLKHVVRMKSVDLNPGSKFTKTYVVAELECGHSATIRKDYMERKGSPTKMKCTTCKESIGKPVPTSTIGKEQARRKIAYYERLLGKPYKKFKHLFDSLGLIDPSKL